MLTALFDVVRKRVYKRRLAYRAVFQPRDEQLTEAARIVLSDLKAFCRVTSSTTQISPITGRADPIVSAQIDGRREVFLRIAQNLYLSDEDLYRVLKQEVESDE